MGIGGTNRRSLALVLGVLCTGAVGCRTHPWEGEASFLLAGGPSAAGRSSPMVVYRFGRWLEVDDDPAARSTLERACLLEQTGASDEAIAVLSEAIENRRECSALYAARGALYVAARYPRAGAADFRCAVDLAPGCQRSWFALGHAYEIVSLSHLALEAFERAVSLGCKEPRLFVSLARVYRTLGRGGQAARHYELALTLEPAGAELLVEAALLAGEDRRQAAAVEAVRAALSASGGVQLSDEARFLRTLLQESPDVLEEESSIRVRVLAMAPAELASLTGSLLTALQLTDAETRVATRERLLFAEQDENRRAALEICLARN